MNSNNATGTFHKIISFGGLSPRLHCHLALACPVEFQQILVVAVSWKNPYECLKRCIRGPISRCDISSIFNLLLAATASFKIKCYSIQRERIQDLPITCWQYIRALINYGYSEPTAAQGHQPGYIKKKKKKNWPQHCSFPRAPLKIISATVHPHCNTSLSL